MQREKHRRVFFSKQAEEQRDISPSPPRITKCYTRNHATLLIKTQLWVIVAVYALFAAIAGILYVMNSITQAVVTDWLVKVLYVALIFMAFTVIIGFITQRGK